MSNISAEYETIVDSFRESLRAVVAEIQENIRIDYMVPSSERKRFSLSRDFCMSFYQAFWASHDFLELFQTRLNDWEAYRADKEFYDMMTANYESRVLLGTFDGPPKVLKVRTFVDFICELMWEYNMTSGFNIDIFLEDDGNVEMHLVDGYDALQNREREKPIDVVVLKLNPIKIT